MTSICILITQAGESTAGGGGSGGCRHITRGQTMQNSGLASGFILGCFLRLRRGRSTPRCGKLCFGDLFQCGPGSFEQAVRGRLQLLIELCRNFYTSEKVELFAGAWGGAIEQPLNLLPFTDFIERVDPLLCRSAICAFGLL